MGKYKTAIRFLQNMEDGDADRIRKAAAKNAFDKLSEEDRMSVKSSARHVQGSVSVKGMGEQSWLELLAAVGRWLIANDPQRLLDGNE